MKLVSFDGRFGRVDGDALIPMGPDLVAYLATGGFLDEEPIPLGSVRLRAPVTHPGKVVCIGLNYRDHAEEAGLAVPEEPILFAKFANSVIGPGDAIEIPPATTRADYEAELGVVIGRNARDVDADGALDHVAGYTCLNDVSARELQANNVG